MTMRDDRTNRRKKRLSQRRQHQRKHKRNLLKLEALESRKLLAAVQVGNTLDVVNGDTSSISALVGSDGGDGISLREAITAAGNSAGADTISFAPALTAGGDATINLSIFDTGLDGGPATTSEFGPTAFIIRAEAGGNNDLTIEGPTGDNGITIARDSTDAFRLFHVQQNQTLTLRNLTLSDGLAIGGSVQNQHSGGAAAGMGGAIFNQGNLTIQNSLLTGNTATGGDANLNQGPGNYISVGASVGSTVSNSNTNGGGPNVGSSPGGNGGFGGGGGAPVSGGQAGNGGFGGGGGGGYYDSYSPSNSRPGGNGGFGAGGGGGASGFSGAPGASGFGAQTAIGTRPGAGAGMGGAIFNAGGNVTITNSTVSANSANGGSGVSGTGSGMGGGLFSRNGTVNLTNSTFATNTVSNGSASGGAIMLVADGAGAADSMGTGITAQIDNTIFADSTGGSDAAFHTLNSGTSTIAGIANIIEANDATNPLTTIVATNVDPELSALADNGGPTRTHAIAFGSPAMHTGDVTAAANASLTVDQRGLPRSAGEQVDIGAFELQVETASLIVSTTADVVDPTDNLTSLREAINFAETSTGAGTVIFDFNVFGTPQTITLALGEFQLTNAVTINGPSSELLTIDGNNASRHFNVDDSDPSQNALVRLRGMTLVGGRAPDGADGTSGTSPTVGGTGESGGAIFNAEDLTLTDMVITGNSAGTGGRGGASPSGGVAGGDGGSGGGVFSSGALNLIDSTVRGNTAGTGGEGGGGPNFGGNGGEGGDGGGIAGLGSLYVRDSSISNNAAGTGGAGSGSGGDSGNGGKGGDGGGIASNFFLDLSNSTVSGNNAGAGGEGGSGVYAGQGGNGGDGGGIYNSGTLTISHATINASGSGAGGVGGIDANGFEGSHGSPGTGGGLRSTADASLNNSIVAGSTSGTDVSVAGTATGSFNLVQDGSDGLVGTITGDPLLRPLANNGGSTLTHALEDGSPAIDSGDPAVVAGQNGSPQFDQRINQTDCVGIICNFTVFPRVISGRVDIGAFESTPLVVNSTADIDDGDSANSTTTLREAIRIANVIVGVDTITFDPTVFATAQTINVAAGEMRISDPLIIDASALSDNVTLDAQQNSRIFHFQSSTGDLTITNVNLQNGLATGSSGVNGGAIQFQSSGVLTVRDSIIRSNRAGTGFLESGSGGGIWSAGAVNLLNSTLQNNTANSYGSGGGIFSDAGMVTISGSTITGGLAYQGGGIRAGSGPVHVVNSTVSGNRVERSFSRGGGIRSDSGTVTIENSTITRNTTNAISYGGGVSTGSNLIVSNSIIAQNTTAFNVNPDLEFGGTITANFSLIGTAKDTSLTEAPVGSPDANGNLIGGPTGGLIDPRLSDLTDNGGTTLTHVPLLDSPVIDAGNTATTNDQRGLPRPVDQALFANPVGGNGSDIGAVELQGLTLTVTVADDELDAADIVPSTVDLADLSLREALTIASSTTQTDSILFAIPGSGPHVISVTSPLPAITSPITIDGTSEPDFAGSPVVGIDGSAAGATADGLKLENSGSTVQGLAIYNFGRDGIELNGGGNHTISQNWLGLQTAANAAGNEQGLRVRASSGNTIDGNVFSGNSKSGVLINGTGATGNVLINNLIGTDPTGQLALGNQGNGLLIQSPMNTIGQTGAGNTISANSGSGISVSAAADQTVIQANRIGTNRGGTADLGNNNFGVQLRTANNQVLGNLISGNQRHGVLVSTAAATGNRLLGNQIGVDTLGTTAIPNNAYGVYVTGASSTVIGTNLAGEANLISGNGGSGVVVVNSTATAVTGNKIGTTTDGLTALGNGANGISMFAGSTGTTVESNQIAGNAASQISISGATTTGNILNGNLIGVNANQSAAIAGGPFGILLKSPTNTVTGNTIAGATRGVVFSGTASTGNNVSGNFIGTDATSTAALGMPTGVQFSQGAVGNTVGPDNVIANNSTGVRMVGSAGVANKVTENAFLNNSIIGIDFANPGPTTNDADDVDEGANRQQNHPVLESAIINGNNLNVRFSVPTAVANATYDLNIEVYKSDANGQGQVFLGTVAYTTANAGAGTITRAMTGVAAANGLQSGDFISATATDAAGNTSEFSAAVAIPGAAPLNGGVAGGRSAMDISGDGRISALDALMVINNLGSRSEGESAIDRRGDVNGDANVTALDALQIINWLSEQNRDDSDSDALLFAAQVDEIFADDDEKLLESAAAGLF